MKEEIMNFLNNRPDVVAAYGYGSGIIKQSGYSQNDKPQLDLILVVEDLKKWHLANMEKNPNDYSIIGKKFFTESDKETLKGSTGITYLSNIEENGNIFKYGTIERLDLQNHLYYWDSFYMPGRFQKVVYPIIETDGLQEAIKINRENALMISALLSTDNIVTKEKLLNKLCSLSYLGDTRMKFAENPNKVKNIVSGSFDKLCDICDFNVDYFEKDDENKEELFINHEKIEKHIQQFPLSLRKYLNDEIDINKIIRYFTLINRMESTEQTIKGVKTNGVVKSVNYGVKKLAKRFKR